MIFKEMDDRTQAIQTLERCIVLAAGDAPKRARIEEELRTLRAGLEGEREAAYQINFHAKDRQHTGVIHDLRIELADGRTAQIDHLLINRANIFYVLESKSFKHGVKITEDGEFLRWNDWKKKFEGMASPIEQSKRHALVLGKLIESLGLPAPEIRCFTLVSPKSRIDRPKHFDTSQVVKADQFFDSYLKALDNTNIFKLIYNVARTDPIENIATYLIGCHKPIIFDYEAKFGLAQSSAPPAPTVAASATQSPVCRHCSSTEVSIQHGRFGYYFKCTSCDGNTPVKLRCHLGHDERLRKEKATFHRECAECKTTALYFTNPGSQRATSN